MRECVCVGSPMSVPSPAQQDPLSAALARYLEVLAVPSVAYSACTFDTTLAPKREGPGVEGGAGVGGATADEHRELDGDRWWVCAGQGRGPGLSGPTPFPSVQALVARPGGGGRWRQGREGAALWSISQHTSTSSFGVMMNRHGGVETATA